MFPLKSKVTLPAKNEPGSFGFPRKHDVHTGVDLYCSKNEPVYAIEDGFIVRSGRFTGASVGSPWWNETDYILIKGASGAILYGEISLNEPQSFHVQEGQLLGWVKPVLKTDKGLPMNMLHIELYDRTYTGDGVVWELYHSQPSQLMDITPILKRELGI